MSGFKIIRSVVEPLKGFFQNLIHSDKYFAGLKDSEIKKLSYRILNCYNEKNFTAIDVSCLTKKQIQKIDLKHLQYWISSKQIEKIAHLLSDQQMLFSIERRYFPTFFVNLSLYQKMQIFEESRSNLSLANLLKKHFPEMTPNTWVGLWNYVQKSNNSRVSKILLNHLSTKFLNEFVVTQSPGDTAHLIKQKPSTEKDVGNVFKAFTEPQAIDFWKKIDLKNPLNAALIKLFLNNCPHAVLEKVYEIDAKGIHTVLSQGSFSQLDVFYKTLSKDAVVSLLVSDDLNSFKGSMTKILEVQSPKDRELISQELSEKVEDLSIDQLAFILPHFPLYAKLSSEKVKALSIHHCLPTSLKQLEYKQLAELFDVLAVRIVKEFTTSELLENIFPLLPNNDAKQDFLNRLPLSNQEWANVLKGNQHSHILEWFLKNSENKKLLKTLGHELSFLRIVNAISNSFSSFNEERIVTLLNSFQDELFYQLIVLVAERVGPDNRTLRSTLNSLLPGYCVKLLGDQTAPLAARKNFLEILVENNHSILPGLLNGVCEPVEVMSLMGDLTDKNMSLLCNSLKPEAIKNISTALESLEKSKLNNNLRLLEFFVKSLDLRQLSFEDIVFYLPLMNFAQIKSVLGSRKVSKIDEESLKKLLLAIDKLDPSLKGNALGVCFAYLPVEMMIPILNWNPLNIKDKGILVSLILAKCSEGAMQALSSFCKAWVPDTMPEVILRSMKSKFKDSQFLFSLLINIEGDASKLITMLRVEWLRKNKDHLSEFTVLLARYMIDKAKTNPKESDVVISYLEAIEPLTHEIKENLADRLLKKSILDEIKLLKTQVKVKAVGSVPATPVKGAVQMTPIKGGGVVQMTPLKAINQNVPI